MLSETAVAALHDIEHNIDLAYQFIENRDITAFRADVRTVYAVTRCLEIISATRASMPPRDHLTLA